MSEGDNDRCTPLFVGVVFVVGGVVVVLGGVVVVLGGVVDVGTHLVGVVGRRLGGVVELMHRTDPPLGE